MPKEVRYIHQEVVHNFTAPTAVIPQIIEMLNPKSIVDVGCGIGTWLKVFQDFGIKDVLGLDGDYVDRSLLKIESQYFKAIDLEKKFSLDIKYELALSLEVAEHLSESSADIFIQSLCNVSDTIIFSAAVENQGGQNHINEQNLEYWITKFNDNNFELFDVLRPIIWDDKQVDFWYRQNMVIFTKNESVKLKLRLIPTFLGKTLIHPEALFGKQNRLNYSLRRLTKIERGNESFKYYAKLVIKYLLSHFRAN